MAAALTMTVEPGAFVRWMGKAKPGQKLVYARGKVAPHQNETFRVARDAAEEGRLRLHCVRNGDVFDWLAVRLADLPPLGRDAPPVRDSMDPDSPLGRLLVALRRAIRMGAPCPTNGELARISGLRNAQAVRYQLSLALAANLISFEDKGPRRRRIARMPGVRGRTAEGDI